MKLLVLAGLIAAALAVNHHGHTVEDIINMVAAQTDANSDGFVSLAEFETELLGQFDTNADGIVPRSDFVNLWMAQYGDNHADTNKFFDNLDANSDHQLAEADIIAQLSELGLTLLDILNPSAVMIPIETFKNFIRINHPGHGSGR